MKGWKELSQLIASIRKAFVKYFTFPVFLLTFAFFSFALLHFIVGGRFLYFAWY